MEKISFILSLYLAILSFVPCNDGLIECTGPFESNTEIQSNEHDHSDHADDHCTPFCICVCCGSIISLPSSHFIHEMNMDISTRCLFTYRFDYSLEYVGGVWHPPAHC